MDYLVFIIIIAISSMVMIEASCKLRAFFIDLMCYANLYKVVHDNQIYQSKTILDMDLP